MPSWLVQALGLHHAPTPAHHQSTSCPLPTQPCSTCPPLHCTWSPCAPSQRMQTIGLQSQTSLLALSHSWCLMHSDVHHMQRAVSAASTPSPIHPPPLHRLSIINSPHSSCATPRTISIGHSNNAATTAHLQWVGAGSHVIAGVALDLLTA